VVFLTKIKVSSRDGPITPRLYSLDLQMFSRKKSLKGIIYLLYEESKIFIRLALDLGVPVVSMNQIIKNVVD
jgi:hypothetical protein